MGPDHLAAASPIRRRQNLQGAFLRAAATWIAALWVACAPLPAPAASTFTTIHTFDGTDGAYTFKNDADGLEPQGLIGDADGNLYGDELYGGPGTCSCGLVFKLSPPATGQTEWTKTVLHAFQGGNDGAYPRNGLARDASGNLFGSTVQGGVCANQCSTVFELSPPPPASYGTIFTIKP